MKIIEVDEELYQYIAGNTQSIGESASDILRRLLNLSPRNAYVSLSENQSGLTPSSSNEQTKVTEQPIVFEEEINKPVIRKQSDEVMQKTITKLESLLNSEEFKQ